MEGSHGRGDLGAGKEWNLHTARPATWEEAYQLQVGVLDQVQLRWDSATIQGRLVIFGDH